MVQALKIFAAALAIRWIYCFLIFVWMGNDGLVGTDSSSYLEAGRILSDQIRSGQLQGWDVLGFNPYVMPLHTWLVGMNMLLFGPYSVLSNVMTQGLFDAGTCVLVGAMARLIDSRYATYAAVAAAINPTQIVVACLVYPDSAFVFFVALILLGALSWLRAPSWRAAIMITCGFVGAAWLRILIVPFAPCLAVFLLAASYFSGRLTRIQIVQAFCVALVLAASVAPISLRNHTLYGSWALTPQGGVHLSRWVVPLIWEVNNGVPWVRGYEEMERRAAALPIDDDTNPFQQSNRYTKVAMEELRRTSLVTIAKAWVAGAVLNIGTPAIVLSPPVSHLPRTGFYATPGTSMPDKIFNFLFRGDNALYVWLLLAGGAGLVVFRLLQLIGLGTLAANVQWAPTALLVMWCLFILAVNGPIAQPKYRLPMEPALAVFTAAGWWSVRKVFKKSAA